MASALPLISSFLLSLLLCFCCSNVHGVVGGQNHHVVSVDSLMPATVCSTPKGSNQKSLKITHRRGPCSPVIGKKPNHHQILRQDQLRVASLKQRLSKATQGVQIQESQATLPAKRGDTVGIGNYIVTVGFGTPKKDQTVVFDTGSDVCWIQCKPCLGSCYPQQDPVFDPSGSSSYQNVSCNSLKCSQLNVNGCSGGTCLYRVQYGDNSSTIGFLSKDTLTLTPSDVFPDFVFGCGQRNTGTFGRIAGLLGLGRDAFSLVSQTSQKFGLVFSYCLPPSSSSTGYLTFGEKTTSNVISFTSMLTDERDPSLYFLSLTGISVSGQQLPIQPTVFSTAGTIIDSGTVITRLPPSAYELLRSAFRSGMSEYPMAQPVSLLDTCYDLSGKENITIPSVVLHLDKGVDIDLDLSGIVYAVDISHVCLAFAGNGDARDVGIIGNVQQRTFEVTYDLGMKRIGFGSGACS